MKANSTINAIQQKLDPLGIMQAYIDLYYSWMFHPEEIYPNMLEFLELTGQVNSEVWRRALGEDVKNPIIPRTDSEQFKDPIWQQNPFSDLLKEYYLLNNYLALKTINATKDVSQPTKRRASFWTQQFFNALSPANFFLLNPRAIKDCLASGGKTIEEGLHLLAEDLKQQNISMVDASGFKVGENLATTPGKVIFRCELFELIQYTPTTDQVHSIPIVIIPPWINKFYVLDLTPKKSVIQYLLSQKHTVFMVSWRNPPESMRNTTFDDYVIKGILQAINVAKSICQVEQVHCIGYCVGGTALGTLLAWLNSDQQEVKKKPIAHFTLFCSLFTFDQPGEIDIFIDEKIVTAIESQMAELGYIDGSQMGQTFRLLRSNSLLWSYFTNSYLLGQAPTPFDILFWNTDNTRIPEKAHSFYLRQLYLENNLARKDALVINGQKLDLGRITQPAYVVGTEQDHITPWKETFKSIQLTGGEKRYVLSTSGHIIGIINPPVNPPKRDYWVGETIPGETAEQWRDRQKLQPGSWWGNWADWLDARCGALQAPPAMGNKEYTVICDAPGSYVIEK